MYELSTAERCWSFAIVLLRHCKLQQGMPNQTPIQLTFWISSRICFAQGFVQYVLVGTVVDGIKMNDVPVGLDSLPTAPLAREKL